MKTIFRSNPAFIVCFLMMFGCNTSVCNAQSLHNQKAGSGACSSEQVDQKVMNAVVVLYGEMDDSSKHMFCTGTVFEHIGNKYRIVTAAHCVSDDDLLRSKAAAMPLRWYVSFEGDKEDGSLLEVRLVGVGFQTNGDDFAVLELQSDKKFPVIPLSLTDPSVGEEFVNVASPMGLGKQLFYGQVSSDPLKVPIVNGTINWRENVLVQTQSGPGASGSSIIDRCTGKIIGILVGSIAYPNRGTPNVVVVPVSRFRKFYDGIKNGSYKYFDKDPTTTNSFWAGQATRFRIFMLRERAFNGLMYNMNTKNVTSTPNQE